MKKLFLFISICSLSFSDHQITNYLDVDFSVEPVSSSCSYIDATFAIVTNINESSEKIEKLFEGSGLYVNTYNKFSRQMISNELVTKFCSSKVSPELLAQILAHLSVYKYCIKNDINTALIIQGKVIKKSEIGELERLVGKLQTLDLSWDIFYTDPDYHDPKNGQYIAPKQVKIRKKSIDEELSITKKRYGAKYYVINKSGMKKILDAFDAKWPDKPLDSALDGIPGLFRYCPKFDILTNNYKNQSVSSTKPKASKIPSNMTRTDYEVGRSFNLEPEKLLNTSRFDIVAKYIYSKYHLNQYKTNWHKKLYKTHIQKWNNFYEGDPLKVGFKDFETSFHDLLESLQACGFQSSAGTIPINNRGTIKNGSHRVGACLALNISPKVTVENKAQNESPSPFYSTLRNKHHLDEKYLDHMALEYAKIKKNTYIVTLYPSAFHLADKAKSILKKYGDIVYSKDIWVTENGSLWFTQHLYLDENWVGRYGNNFREGRVKTRQCFPPDLIKTTPMRVYLYECESRNTTQLMKDEFRKIAKLEKHSIHVNDKHHQTVALAGAFFNKNSINFLNKRKFLHCSKFEELFEKLRQYIKENNIDPEDICIDGSAILSAYGLRDCRDIDLFHKNKLAPTPHDIESHNGYLKYHVKGLDEILYDPTNHFYYKGVKFLKPNLLKKMKKNRGEPKDFVDAKLIDSIL